MIDTRRHEEIRPHRLELAASAELPTRHGTFRALAFESPADGSCHLVLVAGGVRHGPGDVRVQVQCWPGHAFRATGCPCRERLEQDLEVLARTPGGILVFLRESHHRPDRTLSGCPSAGHHGDRSRLTRTQQRLVRTILERLDQVPPAESIPRHPHTTGVRSKTHVQKEIGPCPSGS